MYKRILENMSLSKKSWIQVQISSGKVIYVTWTKKIMFISFSLSLWNNELMESISLANKWQSYLNFNTSIYLSHTEILQSTSIGQQHIIIVNI